jgi:hypothetical protein
MTCLFLATSAYGVLLLTACRAFPVEFAEPAGARLRLADRAEDVLPVTLDVHELRLVALELEFDAATLVGYGMDPVRATELVDRGEARIRGQLGVRRGEDESGARRFALPGALVVRAFVEHETLRCWWPPEGGDMLYFEGVPAGDSVHHPMPWGRRDVAAHTPSQESSEFAAALLGALIGLALLIAVVSGSM